MTAPPLTIRNLTATPVTLRLIERYENPSGGQSSSPFGNLTTFVSNITSNVTNLVSNAPSGAPSAPRLAENAESFARQDVDVRVEPFSTVRTEISATERGPSEVLRLTLDVEGQQYRIDTPSPKNASQTFTPLVPDPRFQLTGIFLPRESYLAVLSSANLQAWMRELRDDLPLAALSIPGTHNSPTYHVALPSVRCQAVSPAEQLRNGVRFFDIRVQPESPDDGSKDGLILVHGVFPVSLTGNKYFRDLIKDTEQFLQENPSETVIISVKREGPGTHTDQQLSLILKNHYAGDENRWFTQPRVPTLGEARGKIVLMRRFVLDDSLRAEHGGAGWAIDAENWAYNTACDTHGAVCVQDFCEVLETENIDHKIRVTCEHLSRSAAVSGGLSAESNNPLYLNFLSASNFWKVGCWPDKIAAKLNPAVIEHLCTKHHVERDTPGDGTTGVVVCDWVGDNGNWDLIRAIVAMNSRILLN